jgi:hypothetical protein
MKNTYPKYIFLLVLILSISELQSQEAIPVAGGEISGSGGSVSFTLGQVFFHHQAGPQGTVSEGIQQPYLISVADEATGTKDINLTVLVYPNPATHILNLEVHDFGHGKMVCHVFNLQGDLLKQIKITSPKTSIEMSHFPSSTYFVRLVKDSHIVKTYKIIKN